MPENEPLTKLDARYSDEKATADDWTDAVERLKAAEIYWLSTVRPEGRPHVTPLIGVWHDGGLHFCTGADERKAKNLRDNREVVLTTGANALSEGYDVVVEGAAARVTDETRLRALADAYVEKYGSDWTFEVRDGEFVHQAGTALVFRVEPRTAFGFAKSPYSQTRWQFTE
ncbi:pyridoxamine 5'-phosphate oxidase family protein [Streptomyces sp. NBC_01481]|uniref:pyridoxamine 5'-phosphate oxidase family protein n=1 Tax=Streptomyces sp. NBC_01481 TaxID=2975869 RepID=UPI00224E85D5|nr:pyridoxamine 5'-phosphate oxidase family protein [Streptomyces sp. NBC_01481]MCX4582632.1 pyridoxamine 5'-phosphate oxidase family protein [Streptomyces sp. NBC_01481]